MTAARRCGPDGPGGPDRRRGILCGGVIALALAVMLALPVTVPAAASFAAEDSDGNGVMADGLTVKVGYAGQEPETVKEYTIGQLEALGTQDQVFSWITSVGGNVIHTTRGVSLKAILEEAGIDRGSVARIHFTCSDAHETEELTVGYLFDQKRYYYPNLVKTWNYDEGKAGPGASEGRIEVVTVLALQDNWLKTVGNGDEPAPYDSMVPDKRLRLAFGMTDTETSASHNSAKWIRSIEVVLAGKPPEEAEREKREAEKREAELQEARQAAAREAEMIGSEKGDRPDGSALAEERSDGAQSDRSDGDDPDGGGAEQEAAPTAAALEVGSPAAIVAADTVSAAAFRELSVDGMGDAPAVAARRDGYQPWRISEISADAVPYAPAGDDDGMAGPAAGAVGGLIGFGGVMQYLLFRRIGLFRVFR